MKSRCLPIKSRQVWLTVEVPTAKPVIVGMQPKEEDDVDKQELD